MVQPQAQHVHDGGSLTQSCLTVCADPGSPLSAYGCAIPLNPSTKISCCQDSIPTGRTQSPLATGYSPLRHRQSRAAYSPSPERSAAYSPFSVSCGTPIYYDSRLSSSSPLNPRPVALDPKPSLAEASSRSRPDLMQGVERQQSELFTPEAAQRKWIRCGTLKT
jgi:hypothetical protein